MRKTTTQQTRIQQQLCILIYLTEIFHFHGKISRPFAYFYEMNYGVPLNSDLGWVSDLLSYPIAKCKLLNRRTASGELACCCPIVLNAHLDAPTATRWLRCSECTLCVCADAAACTAPHYDSDYGRAVWYFNWNCDDFVPHWAAIVCRIACSFFNSQIIPFDNWR